MLPLRRPLGATASALMRGVTRRGGVFFSLHAFACARPSLGGAGSGRSPVAPVHHHGGSLMNRQGLPAPSYQLQHRRCVLRAAAAADEQRVVLYLTPAPRRPLTLPRRLTQGRRMGGGGRSGPCRMEVDVMSEGGIEGMGDEDVEELMEQLEEDGKAVMAQAMALKAAAKPGYRLPQVVNVSLTLCGDDYIAALNKQHRGKDEATDVLSFEIQDDLDGKIALPVKLLGDLVISVDTARRQAAERSHSLLDEIRVLLVHGVLHLCGYDHERGEADAKAMAAAEQHVLSTLGYNGQGLIDSAHSAALASSSEDDDDDDDEKGASGRGSSSAEASSSSPAAAKRPPTTSSSSGGGNSSSSGGRGGSGAVFRSSDVRLVALDMDGTLLDGQGRIRPSSAAAIRAACGKGVRVVLATGKARPAALKACRPAGLEGDELVVSLRTPGVFLQGLAVHGASGVQLSNAQLPPAVVRAAFDYAAAHDVALCGFTGDECVTLKMTPELQELHRRYYEPLAHVYDDVDALLSAHGAVRKLLFMSTRDRVDTALRPHWLRLAEGGNLGASIVQAVPDMLEVVPLGVNKWAGLSVLLRHLDVAADEIMAVGDGSNDLEMVSNAGVGVAMANAVAAVKAAASLTVGGHDEDGIAEAFERFVL